MHPLGQMWRIPGPVVSSLCSPHPPLGKNPWAWETAGCVLICQSPFVGGGLLSNLLPFMAGLVSGIIVWGPRATGISVNFHRHRAF